MSLQRILSIVALLSVTFIFVDSASSQPRAPGNAPAAAKAAEHEGARHECMGMMDKHSKRSRARDGAGHADHASHDRTAAAGRGYGMGNKH